MLKKTKSDYQKVYYQENKDRYSRWRKEHKKDTHKWKVDNKENIKKYNKIYYITNKKHLNNKSKQYYHIRYKKDLNYKLKILLRNRLYSVVSGKNKTSSVLTLVDCSLSQLKQYLESKFYTNSRTGEMMNWNNQGRNGWHIDHITPCDSFDLSDPEQQKICFHYTNLQPLWWWENLEKFTKTPNEVSSNAIA